MNNKEWSFTQLEISETTGLCNPYKFLYLYVIISHNCTETQKDFC